MYLSGNLLYLKEELMILVNAKTEYSIPNFKKKALMPSTPHAFVFIEQIVGILTTSRAFFVIITCFIV